MTNGEYAIFFMHGSRSLFDKAVTFFKAGEPQSQEKDPQSNEVIFEETCIMNILMRSICCDVDFPVRAVCMIIATRKDAIITIFLNGSIHARKVAESETARKASCRVLFVIASQRPRFYVHVLGEG